MGRIVKSTVIVVIAALLMDCGGGRKLASDRPEWVDRGGGFFTGERGQAFYGVGAAGRIPSVSLRRSAADAQARVDLTRVFHANVRDLLKAYTLVGGPYRGIIEQHTQEVIQALMEMDLPGSHIIDRWNDPAEKTQYALAVLDLSMFQERVDRMSPLSSEVRDALRTNARFAFKRLAEGIR